MALLFKNKAYVYLLCAAFFRFMGGYSLGYWGKTYFSMVYEDYNNEFSIAYFLILIFGGIPSEIIGGYICDKYEAQYPKVKGHVSAAGAALASIFIVLTFMIKTSFWWSVVFYYFEYLTAEVFFGPSFAQINILVQSQIQGLAVAIFMLVGAVSGSLATLVLGYLGDKYDIDNNPDTLGVILGCAVLVSYIGCIPFFLKNADEYARVLKF